MDIVNSIIMPAIISSVLSVATTYWLLAQGRRRLLRTLTRQAGYILAGSHPEIRDQVVKFVREELSDLEPEDMRAIWPVMETTLRSQAQMMRQLESDAVSVRESVLAEFRARLAEGLATPQGMLDQLNAWVPFPFRAHRQSKNWRLKFRWRTRAADRDPRVGGRGRELTVTAPRPQQASPVTPVSPPQG
jgi:hypothetical protein